MTSAADRHPGLMDVLERARSLGFLGPGPVEDQLEHARGFLQPLAGITGRVVDLGSGGGAPGLIVAVERPDLEVVLLDAMAKRCRFLEQSVATLSLSDRVSVVEGRAEAVGRSEMRASARAVVSRSFGPPATTAECAAPLLHVSGLLVVSEPPDGSERWPAAGLEALGMTLGRRIPGPPAFQLVEQVAPCPDRFPRRDGVPAKRPLF